MSSLVADLPVDVLYHVFQTYKSSSQQPFPEVKLTQVCRHWRYAGLDLAALWNNFSISFKTPLPAVSLYLQRSRDTPLTLDCDLRRIGRVSGVQGDAERVSRVWKLVVAAAIHWQHLSLKFDKPDANTVIHDLARAHTPMLERLLLWTNVQNDINAPLFGRGVLNLEVLSLRGIHFNSFDPGPICTVKRLELSMDHPISLIDFRAALSRMPWLEHLSLHGNVVAEWPVQLGEEVIEIPTLRSLRLAEQHVPMAIPLLSISAPLLSEIALVGLTSQDLLTTSISSVLGQNYPALNSIVLSGIVTEVEDFPFRLLFQSFPELDHLALIQVSEFIASELNCALRQPSLWPQFQTIFETHSPEGQTIFASKHHSPCDWEATRVSHATQRTRSEWLGGLSADGWSPDHEAVNALRYLLEHIVGSL